MGILYRIGYAVCHQLPERSIFIDGNQLPVCARDTGIYIGSLLSLFFILSSHRRKTNAIPIRYISFTFVFFMLLMGFDAASSYLGFRGTTNSIRLITGLLCGISFPFFLYPILIDNLLESQNEVPILKYLYELFLLLLLAASFYFLILRFNSDLFYPISSLIIVGVLSLHYLIFITFLSLILYNLYPKKKIIKPLIIFPSGFILLTIEFFTLTKLHNLINR